MKKITKRILSLLLVVSMLLQYAPVTVFADNGTPNDGGETVKVTLALGTGESAEGVTMPKGDTVPKGTAISRLSTPEKQGYLFKGWYYDADCTAYAYPNDKLEKDTTLYAAFMSRKVSSTDENGNYVASMDLKDPGFRYVVTSKAPALTDEQENYLTILGIDMGDDVPEWTPSLIEQYAILKDQYSGTRLAMSVTDKGNGVYEITAAEGFTPGRVYQLDLSGAAGLYHVWNGETQLSTVLYHNMSIYREEVMNIKLSDGIRYIPLSQVENMGELEPLLTVQAVDLSKPFDGMDAVESAIASGAKENLVRKEASKVARTGSFVYKGLPQDCPSVGELVCIYAGTSPLDKVGDMDDFLSEEKATYVRITAVKDNYTYEYELAEALDVLDTPVVVPISADADLVKNDGNQITLPVDAFTFEAKKTLPFTMDGEVFSYERMKLDESTKVGEGDFFAVYTVTEKGDVSYEATQSPTILKIKEISTQKVKDDNGVTEDRLVVKYDRSSQEELQNTLSVHATQEYDVPKEFVDEHRKEMESLAEKQFEESDKDPLLLGLLTSEQATNALAKSGVDLTKNLAFNKDGKVLNSSLLGTQMVNASLKGAPLLGGAKSDPITVEAEFKNLDFEPEVYNDLTHWNRKGVGFTGRIRGQVEVTVNGLQEGKGKINIDFDASLTQEFFIDEDFDVDVDWFLCIPEDIYVTACIDIGSWTNLKAELKLSTGFEDDPLEEKDLKWMKENPYTEKLFKKMNEINSELLPKLKEGKERWEWYEEIGQDDYLPWEADDKSIVDHIKDEDEDEDDEEDGPDLSAFEEAYKGILDGVDDTWMQLFKASILELKHSFLGIFCVKLEIGFTFSICGTIQIGFEYNYDYVRRYSATLDVYDFEVTANTTDIQKPHSTFMLYAIGAWGIKPAIYVELAFGFFDTDLDSVSINMEIGVPCILFLYGILTIDNWRDTPVQFQGGLYFKVSLSFEASVGVQVGKGALSTSKTIYETEIPVVSVGSRYQIRGLAGEDENGDPAIVTSMEVDADRQFPTGYYYFDIKPQDRAIYALDMMEGDVVEYYPEAGEYTYEVIPNAKDCELPAAKVLKMEVGGKPVNKSSKGNWGGEPEHDTSKVNTYERIYLEPDNQHSYLALTIKMTYNPPFGVMVKGKSYTKIIHFTLDNTKNGFIVSYANDFYDQTLGRYTFSHDARFEEKPYPTGVEVETEDIPKNRPLAKVPGYTVHGWDVYERPSGSPYNWIKITSEQADQYFVIGKDGKVHLTWDLACTINATPNQQKFLVRHWVRNADDTGYELVAENAEFTNKKMLSDVMYSYSDLYDWGAFLPINEQDEALRSKLTRVELHANNAEEGMEIRGTGEYYRKAYYDYDLDQFVPEERYSYYYHKCAKVTPTDSETPVDIIDCYYNRASYPVTYVAVDEKGDEIRGISDHKLSTYFVEGTVVKLDEDAFFNSKLGGYEFDGWYDISEYEALEGREGDPADTHRMKVDGITVKYKLKTIPVSATVRTQCEADGGLLDKHAKITVPGGGYYTLTQILEMDNTYTGKDGKKIKDMIPDDRTIYTDLSTEYLIGGWGWSERRNDLFEDWSDVTFFLNEVTGWPENLKVRLKFVEGNDHPLVDGQHTVYKEYELSAAEAGCSHFIPCPEELLNDNIKTAPGWVYNNFRNEWFGNFIPEYEGIELPTYKEGMLRDTEDTHYDPETNTLTFTIHSHLYTTTIPYEVTYHYYDGDTEDMSRKKTVTKYGFANEVVNTEREIGLTLPGYETDWSQTPKEFEVIGNGTTKVDYYLKATRYPFTFIIKNERTGELLYEKKVVAEANSKLWLPEVLYPGKNEHLDQAGYKFLRWQQLGGTEYFGNGINSLTGPKYIVATQYSQGVYEAVLTPKEIDVVLHVYDHNKLRISDTTYKLRYNHENPSGQSYTATKNIKAYQKFTIPTPETADGVVFMGWYDNPDFNGEKITNTALFYETTDLYAKYIDKFDVTFVGNGDLRDPFDDTYVYSCSYHQSLPRPDQDHNLRFNSDLYRRSNYTFVGWSTEPNGEVISSETLATPDVTTYYAIWQPKTYQVIFEDADGDVFKKVSHKYGESTTVAPEDVPTRTGYIFKGWQVGDKVYAASDISFGPYDVTYDKYIQPVWEAATYTITYDTDGGVLPGGAPTTWSYKNKVNVESWRPTKAGATFKGWYIGTHHVYTLGSGDTAENVTLKARWNYPEQTIRYGAMTADGKPLDESMYHNPNRNTYYVTDGTLVLADALSRKEWEVTFDHWELIDREGKATTVTELNLADYGDGINLRAVFNKVQYYNISFGTMSGEEFRPYENSQYPKDAYYGENVKAPAPVQSGYIFKGWKCDAFGEELLGTKFEMTKKQDCQFVAVWEKEDTGESVLTINYYKENKEGSYDIADTKENVTFHKGSYVYTLLPEALETGANAAECEFDYLTVSGDEKKYYRTDALQMVSGEYEVNVYYKLKKYTVKIWADRNDSAPYSTEQMYYTDLLELPELPARTGYQFNGWNLDVKADMRVSDVLREKGSSRYAEEVNIFAKDWTPSEYTITYVNWPEGEPNNNPTTFHYDTPDFDLILPVKPGYSIEDMVVETEGKTENITVTLNWEKETYTISYDLGAGTAATTSLPKSFNVDSAFEATTLPYPTLEGCKFLGWTVNGEKVTKVPVAGIYGDYTVKAEYEPTAYKISIDTNGGTEVGISMTPPSTFTYQDILLGRSYRLPSLEKEGCVFKGWDIYNTSDRTHSSIGMAGILTLKDGMYSDLELTALFDSIPLDFSILTYNLNDSPELPAMLATDSVSFFNPMKGLLVEDPSRVGFTFIGWTCNVNLGSVPAGTLVKSLYLDEKNSSQEMELTAHWKTNAAHVTYRLDGGELTTLDKLNVTEDIGSGNYLPTETTVKNAKLFTILNPFELENPTRKDGVKFLGWTSDSFEELAVLTGNVLGADAQLALLKGEPIGSADVEKLLNGAPASDAYQSVLWSLKEQGLTLTANWADKEYTIVYSLGGGELPEGQDNAKTYFNTTDSFTLVNPVRPGYKFLGWKNLVEAITNPETAPVATVVIQKGTYGNLEFEAVWEREAYQIQYNLDGGSFDNEGSAMLTFAPEDTYLCFDLPKKSGCAFTGWKIKNTTTGETLKESYSLRGIMLSELSEEEAAKYLGNLELTAQWKHLYTSVLADANGGDFHGATSGSWSFDQAEGVTLKIEDPQRQGNAFVGWEIVGKNKTGIKFAEAGEGFHTVTIAAGAVDYEGVLLQAKWEPSGEWPYTVYLWYREATGEDAVRIGKVDGTGKFGTKINVAELLTNSITKGEKTYTFDDVTIDVTYSVNGMIQPEGSEPVIAEDTVLDVLIRPAYHKVYFKYSNQEEAEVYAYLMGEKIQKPADIWTAWPGYNFDGWYTDKECTQKFDFDTPVGKEDVYLYSTYEAIKYPITYNNWPASIQNPNPTYFTVDMDEFFVKYPLINPRDTGYDYGGLGEEELRYRDRINVDGLKSVVIDAPFALHKYNIIYNYAYSYDDYTKIQTVYDITQRVELANPIAIGCTFQGYKAMCGDREIPLEGSLADGYAIPKGTTGDIKLIPQFDGTHTITYAGLEGSTFENENPNPTSFSMFDSKFTLENPEKAGYLFLGWSLDSNYPAPYNPLTLPDTLYAEDLTATAMWWPIEYTVTFYMSTDDVTEGTSYKSENYDIARTYEGSYSLYAEDRFNDGYRFDGWTVTDEEGQEVTLTDDLKLPEGTLGNLTAVANYSTIEYKITYDIGEGKFTNPEEVVYTYKPCEVNPMNPVVLPEVSREDVAFMGWYLVNEGMYLRPQAIDGNYGNMLAIALWDEEDDPQPSEYYISYSDVDDYYNTEKYPTMYDGSVSITLPDPQEREGFSFIGWSVVSDETGEVTLSGGNTIPAGTTGILEVTALWKKETVSLLVTLADGTEVTTTTVPVGQQLTAAAVGALVPVEVSFDAIYDGDTYEEFTAVDVTEYMDQITLILVTNDDIIDIVLTSDLEGVTITGDGMAIAGSSREISVNVPEGYDFLGWYVGDDLAYSDATTWITVSAEYANLTAKFTNSSYGPESYVITIETDGNCTIEVFLLENEGGQGGEQQGTAGGEQQGTAGGEQQGTAGGEQQGTAGGEQQGTAGGEQQGTAGGEQQGTAGGEQQGTQGGEQGTTGGRAINSGETVWAGATIRVVTTANENYVLTTQPDEFYTVNGPLTLSATADPTAYALTVTHENGAAPTVSVEDMSSIARGTTVTLTAGAANGNYEFIGWCQPNGKILTESTTYSVVITKDLAVVARYEKTAGIVNFVSNGLIQATVTGNVVTETDFPTVPASPSYGFEFKGWDMTVTEVNQALALGQKVTVNALFAPMKKHMTLNVYNGESETPNTVVFEEIQWYRTTAAEVSGKHFAYWTLDGELFSYNPLADVRVTQDCTLRAVYSEDITETLGTAKIIATEYNRDTKKAMFVSLTNVPEEAIIQGAGLVAASSNNFNPSMAVLSAANADYVKSGTTTGPSINYTWTKSKVEVGDVWYVRAYLVYTLNGEEHTIYGDLVKYVAE